MVFVEVVNAKKILIYVIFHMRQAKSYINCFHLTNKVLVTLFTLVAKYFPGNLGGKIKNRFANKLRASQLQPEATTWP